MYLNSSEGAFLYFYIPLFFLKFVNITAGSIILQVVGVMCFLFAMIHIVHQHYDRNTFNIHFCLLSFTALLVLTSGKQGAFFTVVMLVMMYRIKMDNHLYKLLFYFGLLFLTIAIIYSINDVSDDMRYINGEWIEMTKRSNILFVNLIAVICLFLLVHRRSLNKKKLLLILISSILMFMYTGSRSGLVLSILIVLLLIVFKCRFIRNNIIIRHLCVFSPLYCMLFCIYSGLAFGKHAWLSVLNLLIQGRVEQNSIFLERYNILPFGQRIVEGSDVKGEYLNLDCAYLDMLLCEGMLFSILWVLSTITVIRYYYNGKRMVEVSILVMYAIYGITETFLPNCFLNVSLFLYGEYLYRTRRVGTLN